VELKESNHSYYCECYESPRMTKYESWNEFKENEKGYDLDYNLPFRFDIKQNEDTKEYYLELHHALQRHGCDQWHAVINNLREEDMAEIEEYLKECKKHLLDLWKEIENKEESECQKRLRKHLKI
jgi:hypothetical protein